jgi:hypothetical protein
VARRTTWLIDLGDGTWAVCCMACRMALFRGPKAGADRAAARHSCEPVIPLDRRRRPAYPTTHTGPVWRREPGPHPWTDAPPTTNRPLP